jgi:hypothetical protein
MPPGEVESPERRPGAHTQGRACHQHRASRSDVQKYLNYRHLWDAHPRSLSYSRSRLGNPRGAWPVETHVSPAFVDRIREAEVRSVHSLDFGTGVDVLCQGSERFQLDVTGLLM